MDSYNKWWWLEKLNDGNKIAHVTCLFANKDNMMGSIISALLMTEIRNIINRIIVHTCFMSHSILLCNWGWFSSQLMCYYIKVNKTASQVIIIILTYLPHQAEKGFRLEIYDIAIVNPVNKCFFIIWENIKTDVQGLDIMWCITTQQKNS